MYARLRHCDFSTFQKSEYFERITFFCKSQRTHLCMKRAYTTSIFGDPFELRMCFVGVHTNVDRSALSIKYAHNMVSLAIVERKILSDSVYAIHA